MTRVIAFVDHSPVSPGVINTASALARLVGADLDVVHATTGSNAPTSSTARLVEGPAGEVLVGELGAEDVLCGVIGSRSMPAKSHRVGHIAQHVLSHSTVPLVIVPPNAPDLPETQPTILVPHDDTPATGHALEPMIEVLSAAEARFVLIHVFDDRSVPLAVSSHDLDTIADEFLLRHRRGNPMRCELRIGHAGTQIVEVASDSEIDAILVAWRQETGPGRADVIAHLVRESGVPLIVVPFAD
jgi:nucleotide-binding universal stress UspA family protein